MRFSLWTVVAGLFAISAAKADLTTLTLPSANFNIVNGSPVTQTVTGVAAVNNLLGFQLNGNWTAVAGNAWSNGLYVGYTVPGGTAVAPTQIGGATNTNPFTFPGPSFVYNSFALGKTPTNAPAGNYTFTFTQNATGTTGNLANGGITLFSNPSAAFGDTTGAPRGLRPSPLGFSTVNNNPYRTHTMTVDTTGRYMVALAGNYDTFLTIYGAGGYSPTAPTTNLIAANDESNNIRDPQTDTSQMSVITLDLTAGTNYTVVATGFFDTDVGTYTLYGAGAGTVTFNPVPEPTTVVCIGAAGLAVGGWIRKRRKTTVVLG